MGEKTLVRSLRILTYLVDKLVECGGFVYRKTGKLWVFSGECMWVNDHQSSYGLRGLAEKGWAYFHTHSNVIGSSYPSVRDAVHAHVAGAPEYVLTNRGIYRITPKDVKPVDEVLRIYAEAKTKVGCVEAREMERAYWLWVRYMTRNFPVEIELLTDEGWERCC